MWLDEKHRGNDRKDNEINYAFLCLGRKTKNSYPSNNRSDFFGINLSLAGRRRENQGRKQRSNRVFFSIDDKHFLLYTQTCVRDRLI